MFRLRVVKHAAEIISVINLFRLYNFFKISINNFKRKEQSVRIVKGGFFAYLFRKL